MSHHISYFRSLTAHTGSFDGYSESTSSLEKYASLINVLKGFEEYTLDRNGIIVSSNLEAVNITGYEEWEVIGKNFSIFYSVEDQLSGKPYLDLQKAEERGSIVFSGLHVKKRNPSFWAKIKLRALSDNEEVIGYKMTLQDTTHRAVSNHRVRKLRDEYLSLFNNSFVGFLKFSMADYRIFMINEKANKLLGTGSIQREKLFFHEIFKSEDEFQLLERKLTLQKRVEDFELQVKGTDRCVILSGRYFLDGDFAECVLVDITEFKKKDRELYRLNHELDQFIYHASHELRSPLASMLGIINLIGIERDIDASLAYAGILKEKVHQLDDLLKNIVAISYNNKNDIQHDTIDWNKLVLGVLREQDASGLPIDVRCNVQQESDFTGDLPRIMIMLRNLISNALKYYNPNAQPPWVNISVISNEREARIEISDNGLGIDPDYLNKIFQMFYKANDFAKGSGLGLYITRSIIEKLDGRIAVTSDVNQGATFSVTLPNAIDMGSKQ